MRVKTAFAVALGALALAPAAHAQTVVSPEVTHTGTAPTGYTVTFRIADPTATRMRIRGEWFFSSAADTTTTSSAGRLPSQWRVGDFPIANPNAGDLIVPWALAISKRLKAQDLAGVVFPYPTLSEASKRAAVTFLAPFAGKAWVRGLVGLARRLG